jgi:hypothetical protein
MKTVVLIPVLAVALLSAGESSAQAPAPKQNKKEANVRAHDENPHMQAQRSADKAEKRYALTPEQKNRWQVAAMQRNMERQQIRMQLRGETTPEQRKELRTQAKAQNDQFDTMVKDFLKPEQLAKYEKDKQEREKKIKAKAKAKQKAGDNELPEFVED